ncbi:sortase domain-bontaining protein [Spirillospora sp. NPDC050679]
MNPCPRRRPRGGRCVLVAGVELSQVVPGCGLARSVGSMHGGADLLLPPFTASERKGLAPLAASPVGVVPLAVSAFGRAQPTSLAIPSIGVSAPLTRVGRGEGESVAAPPLSAPRTAGWREAGPAPGEPGAVVLAGLLGTFTGPAVFVRVCELRPGAIVGVVRADETVAVFRVARAQACVGSV